MRQGGLTQWYGYGLLAVLGLIVLHAPLSVWAGSLMPDYSLVIKSWKEIVLLALLVFAAAILTKRKLWRAILADRIIQLCLAYAGLHLLLAVVMPSDVLPTIAGLMIDLRFIAFFMLLYLAGYLLPGMLSRALKVTGIGALIVVGFGILQITILPDDFLRIIGYGSDTIRPYTTIDRNPEFVRINSTLRGPNPLGALLVVYIALLVAYLRQYWHTRASVDKKIITIGGLAAAGVLFASYSRSAYVAAAVAVSTVLASVWRPSNRAVLVVAAGLLLAGAAAFGLQSTDWYANVVLHEDPESTVISKSNPEHLNSLANGLTRVLNQPFGSGVGSTGSDSLYDDVAANDTIIENNYLFVAHESGWLGLGIFIALFRVVL